MAGLAPAAWYELRRAQSAKPATYTCPFCGARFPAMTAHALVTPEGNGARRRHAHMRCVAAARAAGRLPSRSEVTAEPPRRNWRSLVRGALTRRFER